MSCDEDSAMSDDIHLTHGSGTSLAEVQSGSINVNDIQMTFLDGTFFERVDSKSVGEKIVAVCKTCTPNYVEIKGSKNCTSNFVTHLKRKHGNDVLEEYRNYLKFKKTLRKAISTTGQSFSRSVSSAYSQDDFDRDVVKYFAHSMISLRCVENPFFREILHKLNVGCLSLRIISRQTLRCKISEYYKEQSTIIKQEIETIRYVCTTIDTWSGPKRSFLGVTAHWIDPSTLRRQSKALACQRFKGTNSDDKIYELLIEIYNNFGLGHDKVVAAITGNDSNFVHTLRRFGVQNECVTNDEYYVSSNDSMTDSSDCEVMGEDRALSNAVELRPLVDRLAERLPLHLICASHILILCVTVDASKLLDAQITELSVTHQQVFDKCNNLWKAGNHPKFSETVQSVLGHGLSKPGNTRWNSLYDALKQILEIKEKTTTLHKALGLKNPLKEKEFAYIQEYVYCTQPIAEALDILQGGNSMYYGILLPTLLSLRRKLRKLTNDALIYCKPLVQTYIESVERRFEKYLTISTPESENAAIASMSYPRFNKFKWLSCVDQTEYARLKRLFLTAISKEIIPEANTSDRTSNKPKEDEFFYFDSEPDSENQHSHPRLKAELIMAHFVAEERKDLNLLTNYPEIKQVFLKYNTPLPSSSAVERLFSYDTIANCPKAKRHSEEMFQKRVILKANLNYDVRIRTINQNDNCFNASHDFQHVAEGPIAVSTILTLDPQTGAVLGDWGSNLFYMPHGITIDSADNTWVTDVALHQVLKFRPGETRPSLQLGERFRPGAGIRHLCQPTSVAVAREGEVFVADGYCNARVLHLNARGHLLRVIPQPPEFLSLQVPHGLTLIESLDLLCIADRENMRVTCPRAGLVPYTSSPPVTIQAPDLGRVYGVAATGAYVYAVNGPTSPQIPVRGFTLDPRSESAMDRWGPAAGFRNPHGIAICPNGTSLYVTEIGPNKVWKFSLV